MGYVTYSLHYKPARHNVEDRYHNPVIGSIYPYFVKCKFLKKVKKVGVENC